MLEQRFVARRQRYLLCKDGDGSLFFGVLSLNYTYGD